MRKATTTLSALLAAAIACAGCGGSTVTEGPALPSSSPAASDVAVSDLVITRTGGFAGVHETLHIAPDGTVQFTDGAGRTFGCTPDQAAVDRVRAIDLAAVGSGPSKNPIADGFNYVVTWAGRTASASDGENVGLRAELLAAAAAVLASCLATRSQPGATTE
jgi:hypothetical protein